MTRSVAIYTYGDNAYLPGLARIPTGGFLEIDPVIATGLTIEELASAMHATLEVPQTMATPPQLEKVGSRQGVVLQASGMNSWKQLARSGGQSFLVDFDESDIWFQQARADKHGRWAFVKGEEKILLPDTSLETIAQTILDRIKDLP